MLRLDTAGWVHPRFCILKRGDSGWPTHSGKALEVVSLLSSIPGHFSRWEDRRLNNIGKIDDINNNRRGGAE
jgi:hypothetical protein